jgi:hypothetical protein
MFIALYKELGENVTSSDIKHQCLEIVLCANESKAKEKTVTLERWSLVLNWYLSIYLILNLHKTNDR